MAVTLGCNIKLWLVYAHSLFVTTALGKEDCVMKRVRTWILIADGARARVLENDGPGHGLAAVEGHVFQAAHAATHDLVADREGRTYSSAGARRSAIDSRSDPHRELKTKFAQLLGGVLERGLEQDAYDRLIIVATPVTPGDLRRTISERVRSKVAGEVAQDLTKTPNHEVADHLKHVLLA
jgi:protein required for attachment to host cells